MRDEIEDGQRTKALRIVKDMPKGSVGHAIAKILEPTNKFAGNMCAGRVGDFYHEHQNMLLKKATDGNIYAFAVREIRFFRNESFGCTRDVGHLLTVYTRYNLIRLARDSSPAEFKKRAPKWLV